MHSFPVFSSSTTTASINFPMATVTARLYFFWVGLQRSVMRPWTPWNRRFRVSTAWDSLASLSFSCLSAFNSRNWFSISPILDFRFSYFCLKKANHVYQPSIHVIDFLSSYNRLQVFIVLPSYPKPIDVFTTPYFPFLKTYAIYKEKMPHKSNFSYSLY